MRQKSSTVVDPFDIVVRCVLLVLAVGIPCFSVSRQIPELWSPAAVFLIFTGVGSAIIAPLLTMSQRRSTYQRSDHRYAQHMFHVIGAGSLLIVFATIFFLFIDNDLLRILFSGVAYWLALLAFSCCERLYVWRPWQHRLYSGRRR